MLDNELSVNITIHLHEEDLKNLFECFENLPCYVKKDHLGTFYWFGGEDDDEFVCATFNSTSLRLESELPDKDWYLWMALFIKKTSEVLGYQVEII